MRRIESWTQHLDYLALKLTHAPRAALTEASRRLDCASMRLAPALKESVARAESRLQNLSLRLRPPVDSAYERMTHRVERASARLNLLDPFGVLKRGYSMTVDEEGRVVHSIENLSAGQMLKTRLSDGWVRSNVLSREREGN